MTPCSASHRSNGNSFGESAKPTAPGGAPLNNPAMAWEGVAWTRPGTIS